MEYELQVEMFKSFREFLKNLPNETVITEKWAYTSLGFLNGFEKGFMTAYKKARNQLKGISDYEKTIIVKLEKELRELKGE